MKSILAIIMSSICFYSFAQKGLYEAIEQNGLEAEYREFYSVSKGENSETTNVSGDRYWVTASVLKLESGEKIGIKLSKTDGSGDLVNKDVMGRYDRAKGFPNVSYLYHEKENDGFIATGDFIIELNGISSDGLSFKSIESVFVKKQVKEKKEASTEKKKGSKFLTGLKNVAVKAYGGDNLPSLEHKKASSVNLHQIAQDYLKAIKSKQSSYTLTSSEKAALSKIQNLRDAEAARIKKANADYWASPAGQAHYKSYGGNSSSKNEYYYVKNTSNNAVKVGNGNTNHVNSGSTYKVKCGTPIYRYQLNSTKTTWSKGSMISDGKSVCGKTINF